MILSPELVDELARISRDAWNKELGDGPVSAWDLMRLDPHRAAVRAVVERLAQELNR